MLVNRGYLGPLPPELLCEVLDHLGSDDVGAFARTSRTNCDLSLRTLRARCTKTRWPHRTVDPHNRQDLLHYHGEVRRMNAILKRPSAAEPPSFDAMWMGAKELVRLRARLAKTPPKQALRDSLFLFQMARHRPLPAVATVWESLPLAYLGHNARAMENLRSIPPDQVQLRKMTMVHIANGALERDDVALFGQLYEVNPHVTTWMSQAIRCGRHKIAEFCGKRISL